MLNRCNVDNPKPGIYYLLDESGTRAYMNRVIRLRYFLLLFASLALVTVSGCSESAFSTASKSMSQFDVKLMDIGFERNIALFN